MVSTSDLPSFAVPSDALNSTSDADHEFKDKNLELLEDNKDPSEDNLQPNQDDCHFVNLPSSIYYNEQRALLLPPDANGAPAARNFSHSAVVGIRCTPIVTRRQISLLRLINSHIAPFITPAGMRRHCLDPGNTQNEAVRGCHLVLISYILML